MFTFRNLIDRDHNQWCHFIEQAYCKGHILTDLSFLKWFMRNRHGRYKTLIATLLNGKIVGTYGVIPTYLSVCGKQYSHCWYVNGIVLSEYRNQGIGKNFVDLLLDRFDTSGVIGFNVGVKRNYQRFGFSFFDDHTMRRFIKVLYPEAYSLVAKLEFNTNKASELVPISEAKSITGHQIKNITAFDKPLSDTGLPHHIKVTTTRTQSYLNWRYLLNPRIKYECTGIESNTNILAYLVTRHEQYHPTKVFGTRIIDTIGKAEDVEHLISSKIVEARDRHDSLVEFAYAGSIYDSVVRELGFIELLGESYEWFPLVTSPIEYRHNDEYICLGSRKYPDLFSGIQFNSLYFTRGDSDRDRAN